MISKFLQILSKISRIFLFSHSRSEQFGNKIPILNIFPGDAAPTTEGVEKENYAEPTFQENAFLARKAKEAERRRTHRLMKTVQHSPLDTTKTNSVRKKDGKRMEKDLRAVARYSQEVKN